MKLYLFPGSAACRAVQLFMAEAGIEYEPVVVDVLSGEQFEGAYAVLNPSSLVPTLDDDGFVLTESSAILKYLADRMHSPAYPKDLRRRAKVNETMDWFNTQFYREYGYSLECPRFGGHLSAWSALSGWAGRMRRHAKGIELSEAVPAGVPA